jgi:hypothetical protein
MDPITPENTQVLFAQSEASVNLRTARFLIIGCDAWLLKGDDWFQIGTHDHAIPEVDHPIQKTHAAHCTTPILLRLANLPVPWRDVRLSQSTLK